MKNVSTKVSTGDKFKYKDTVYEVGNARKVDGKNKIDLRVRVGSKSAITLQVSTRELNLMLSNAEILEK